jgi:hypothetical protein
MKKRNRMTKWKKRYVPMALVGGLQEFIPYRYWGRTIVYRIEWKLAKERMKK